MVVVTTNSLHKLKEYLHDSALIIFTYSSINIF